MSWTDQCPAQAPGIDLKLGFSACQSHMTAMMAMPPVVPVNHRPLRAVTHVIAMIDAEDAFHAADAAADCCALPAIYSAIACWSCYRSKPGCWPGKSPT